MKFLIIAFLFALLLLLVYSKIYPYIRALRKIMGTAKTIVDQSGPQPSGSATAKSEGKLVRCVGCGTWIPAERIVGTGAGRSVYCSRECIEKTANSNKRKMAG